MADAPLPGTTVTDSCGCVFRDLNLPCKASGCRICAAVPTTTDLGRLMAEASVLAGAPHPCAALGHRWRFKGGKWCGCEGIDADGYRWEGACSVPVYECDACGVCDYGHNTEAAERVKECADAE